MSCSLIQVYRRFRGPYFLHHQDDQSEDPLVAPRGLTSLMMEVVSTSETSVDVYQSTWRKIPKDGHFCLEFCCFSVSCNGKADIFSVTVL
jgi:hypothetical protein